METLEFSFLTKQARRRFPPLSRAQGDLNQKITELADRIIFQLFFRSVFSGSRARILSDYDIACRTKKKKHSKLFSFDRRVYIVPLSITSVYWKYAILKRRRMRKKSLGDWETKESRLWPILRECSRTNRTLLSSKALIGPSNEREKADSQRQVNLLVDKEHKYEPIYKVRKK